MQFFEAVNLVQFEFFAVAALLSASLFAIGFLIGRVSGRGKAVKVPMEVIHALASARLETPRLFAKGAADKDAKGDVVHAVEAILDHVHHEKDFKKAQEYALHEIDKIEHDHGETKELNDLHHKIEHAHNKGEIEAALHDFIEHAKGHH
jgi:hypothetical protein